MVLYFFVTYLNGTADLRQKIVKRKIMANKVQFDLQRNKKTKKKQIKLNSKGLRDKNTVKAVRYNSMEYLKRKFFCDQVESHSDESEKVEDEKTPAP
ncbi:hypothetical protein ROHU_023981 [Labeo rohita]|uniref:Uncharacterized protein n=1 Tax=Labeo rohita TaxID=84645 RepID=A0A498MPG2_LABRO|nr:hypothetical protein ROHU_023981 [Labeo rohita]